MKIRKEKIIPFLLKALRTFVLIGLLFVILLPFYEIFLNAINASGVEKGLHAYWIPTRISFRRIINLWKVLHRENAMYNSLSISLVVSLIQTLMCAIFGYAFARLKFKGSKIIFLIIMLSIFVPFETLHVARVLFFTNNRIFGIKLMGRKYTLYLMALLGAGYRSPLFIYIFRQYFRNIPKDLEEQSLVDGCGIFRSFFKIMLPNAMGGIVTTFLLTFVWTYNDCYYPSLFNFSSNDINLLSTRLMAGRYSNANASALLMIIPLLIIYLFTQKLLIDNIQKSVIM